MNDDDDNDSNFYMDQPWKNCEQCSNVHGTLYLSKDIPAFHCSFCDKYCFTDLILDNSESSKRTVLGLDYGLK